MIIRSRAPLRLGLAGGASDVSPFCDRFGGFVLNASIDAYAHCHLLPTVDGTLNFDGVESARFRVPLRSSGDLFRTASRYYLHKAVYNRIGFAIITVAGLCHSN